MILKVKQNKLIIVLRGVKKIKKKIKNVQKSKLRALRDNFMH